MTSAIMKDLRWSTVQKHNPSDDGVKTRVIKKIFPEWYTSKRGRVNSMVISKQTTNFNIIQQVADS